MNETSRLVVVLLAITIPLLVSFVIGAILYMAKEQREQTERMLVRQDVFLLRQEEHQRGMMDRFLARDFSELTMSNMIKEQAEQDQQEEVDEEGVMFDKYYAKERERLVAAGIIQPASPEEAS